MSDTEDEVSALRGDDTDQEIDELDEEVTVEALLSSTMMTMEGDTLCSALVNIGRQIEMQNRILVKIAANLQKRA
tara:strand:+ start:8237 stop:8461 length:225 start_codon:yes stop_codon:yes gene_type:complete